MPEKLDKRILLLIEQLKLLHDHVKFRIQLSLTALVGIVFGLISLGPVVERNVKPDKISSSFLKITILITAILLVGILWYCIISLVIINFKEIDKLKEELTVSKIGSKETSEEDLLSSLIRNNLAMIEKIRNLLNIVLLLVFLIVFITTGQIVITFIKLFR